MPKAVPSCGAANYFLIATLFVFFMLLYVYASKSTAWQSNPVPKVEKFNPQVGSGLLSNPDKIIVLQGSQAPDVFPSAITWDNHKSMPTVDGTDGTPHSLFMFSFNKCSPSCCNKGSPYSCSGGCVCMTDEQKNFVGTRGSNSKGATCSGQSEY